MQKKNSKISLAVAVIVVLAFWAYPALGTERLVPAQYATIQAAIDIAVIGDTVIVSPGTYNENISFKGKNIILTSMNPDDPEVVANTIIHGDGHGFVVTFAGGEDSNCRLSGFTITGGGSVVHGGGIVGNNSNTNPTISQCVVTGNSAITAGGGIWGCGGTISRCVISSNSTLIDGYGGGIAACHGSIVNCLLYNNNAGYGGAMNNCDGNIINCTIKQNSASTGVINQCDGTITNCIIWGNFPDTITNNTSVITYCCWPAGTSGTGNIKSNPLFASFTDYHLSSDSPCVDTGTNTPAGNSLTIDLDGFSRPCDGNHDSTAITDMGAYELRQNHYIYVSHTELEFFAAWGQGNPADQIITIQNTGVNPIPWQISESCSWMEVSPTSGEATGEVDPVSIRVNTAGLSKGFHFGTIAILDPLGENNLKTVRVKLQIGNELHVPGDYSTIQAAINAAVEGDKIIVEPKTYNEKINIFYPITLQSADPYNWHVVQNTIIDGSGKGSCVTFSNSVNSNTVLRGFTLIHGGGTNGGGIYCYTGASPTIDRCIITGNQAMTRGGGISMTSSNQAVISNCFITENEADRGGGISIISLSSYKASCLIKNCTISNNNTTNAQSSNWGDVNCIGTNTFITNSIIYSNPQNYDVRISDPALISYSCIGNVYLDGASEPFDITTFHSNISTDPQFIQNQYICSRVSWDNWNEGEYCAEYLPRDYHLTLNSPCRNAGDPDYALTGNERDIDGQTRIYEGCIDMGADETGPELTITYPQGGEVWAAGSEHEIRWSRQDVTSNIDLAYSVDGGDNWLPIQSDVSNTGSYVWTLPAVDSANCLVAISATPANPDIKCNQMEEPFTIHASPAGAAVEAGWRMRGHDERRSGKAEWAGPEYGCLKWQYQAAAPISAGMAAGAAGNLHVACEDGTLYTLDPNGEPVWQYETRSRLSGSPAVGPDGSVYFGAENGIIYALDKEGNLRWTHKTDRLVFSSPAVTADGKVYIASQDGTLYALGADGSERWSFTVPTVGAVAGSILASPTIGADGKVYIGGLYQAALYALNPANGSVAWVNNTLAGEGIFCSPVVGADGTIYLITVNSNLLQALNPANGAVVWTLNLADNASGLYENGSKWLSQKGYVEPVVGPDGTIYVSFADPYLRAVNPNGTIKWVSRVGMGMGFNLTVDSGGMIYAASEDGTVYVVEPGSGGTVSQLRGTLYNRAGLFTGMEAVDGEGGRYVGTAAGAISAYAADESLKWQVQLNLSLYANGTVTALGAVQDSPLYVLVEDQPGVAAGYKYLVMLERQTGRTLYGPRVEWGEFLTYKTVQEYPVIPGNGLLYFTDYYNTISAVSAGACEEGPLGLRRPGDVDSSGVVDLADYAVLAATWYMCFDYAGGSMDCYKTCTTCEYEYNGNAVIYQLGDINRDYYVNMGDLVELAAMWLEP